MNGVVFAALVILLFVSVLACCPRAPDERSGGDGADAGKSTDNGR